MVPILNFFLPVAVEIIKAYIKNSSSKKDDLILNTVKDGCRYLSVKDNNTVSVDLADSVSEQTIKGV